MARHEGNTVSRERPGHRRMHSAHKGMGISRKLKRAKRDLENQKNPKKKKASVAQPG